MHFLFGSLFWGIILIMFGISVIFKAVFKINIPIFRTIFAVLLIYWGLKILFGGIVFKSSNTVIFDHARHRSFSESSGGDHNVIFGSTELSFADVEVPDKSIYSEVNIVFGSGSILLNSKIPTILKVDTVFGESSLPDRKISFFGDNIYKNENYVQGEPSLTLQINVIFGSLRIREI